MFNLNVSTRSIQRYLNIMGWEKVRTKYCQAVSLKNSRERIAFATMANHFNDQFITQPHYIQISLNRSS
jgi:hypothetical protein